jgi:flagellum-specific peptidoglycan hydrolase FlgJ
MTPDVFLPLAVAAAVQAQHIWPHYAACEAALESGWGESELCKLANNLFGQKVGPWTDSLPTLALPTHEWVHGILTPTSANWPKFPNWAMSFAARMQLLRAAAKKYPHYAAALRADTGEDFIRQVSATWSTDPGRADKVLSIFRAHCAGANDEPPAAAGGQ